MNYSKNTRTTSIPEAIFHRYVILGAMNQTLSEILLVIVLILLNGFFSGTEIALISIRKTRIRQLVKEGNKKAVLAEKILKNPEEFLATVQVGITLISTIASAFAGANIADAITPILQQTPWPFIANNAAGLSLTAVVLVITYLSVILGELIPKSLGIKFSEKFSLFAVYPMYFLSKIAYPVTKILTGSSNIVLKLFGDKTSFMESKLTEEELRAILYESHKAGTLKKDEHEILDNIFDFSDIAAGQIMTPRSKIFAVDIDEPYEKNIQAIIESGFTRIPVFKDNMDKVLGILNIKDLLRELQTRKHLNSLENLIKKVHFVPNTQRISELLKIFQKGKLHLAMVTDEHGDIDGLVTIEDVLEEIVGDISDESDETAKLIVQQKDGAYTVDGSISIVDYNRYFKSSLPEDQQFTTISGLLLDKFEKIPDAGTQTTIENFEFVIKEKTERMIKTVTVRKLPKE